MALITLGGLELDGFEVPASVRFGGAQRMTVHKLLGGGRVIDTMGRDDSLLRWSGVFSGANASDRARTLDAMRAAGNLLPLSWDVFTYNVIVSQADLDFCNPWWIPYQLECIVVIDLAQSNSSSIPSAADSVLADLAIVSNFLDVASLISALSAPAAFSAATAGHSEALAQIAALQVTVSADVSVAEKDLDGGNMTSVVNASQVLAQSYCARGYLNRAASNLTARFK